MRSNFQDLVVTTHQIAQWINPDLSLCRRKGSQTRICRAWARVTATLKRFGCERKPMSWIEKSHIHVPMKALNRRVKQWEHIESIYQRIVCTYQRNISGFCEGGPDCRNDHDKPLLTLKLLCRSDKNVELENIRLADVKQLENRAEKRPYIIGFIDGKKEMR